ncbi:SDR family NAD(P)-dependent oxidoreductase [Conexibacter sp. W3-3-2]|uniref:Oxidoreductase n=1 Tax=Paraconexibacter algicola TaxID=2133960 RepID=A0A2T4UCJ0_9ACTN|nr:MULTISPECIES: SDR family NAD(P)-dependent oxidoreductase [Solirubrobacterales]MTD43188.1 SDR family NAD(P)-dependent oxidoreductase [Conexibacter sp. W3-3-2]PTL54937.1 oxidoreductase [Paraconexibacter algicola]
MNLHGKTVLLTGATGGIGHAIARRLHREGGTLVLTGRRTDVLEPLAQEIGGRAIAADLADPAAAERLVEEAGDVDVVVANAGLPGTGEITSFSPQEIDRVLDVNLRVPILMTRHYTERLAARGGGHFVFISSLAGKTGSPYSSMYNATKFGLRGFGQGLRHEMAAKNIGVSVVFPGFIRDAGMFVDAGVELPRGVGTSSPEEVADAVVTAIVRNRGEIDVAPLGMRVGTLVAGIAPATAARVSELAGASKIAGEMTAGQVDKR